MYINMLYSFRLMHEGPAKFSWTQIDFGLTFGIHWLVKLASICWDCSGLTGGQWLCHVVLGLLAVGLGEVIGSLRGGRKVGESDGPSDSQGHYDLNPEAVGFKGFLTDSVF